MDIKTFISKFKNHPVLFVGTGMSLRYLNNSYSWDALLKKIAMDLTGSNEYFYDIKSKYHDDHGYKYDLIASDLQHKFDEDVRNDREGKFKYINDQFYDLMEQDINISRFKIYISKILDKLDYKNIDELNELKKARKNISSIITTNYDVMLEDIFGFKPLIGNDILLSDPYGSIYKIHGCVTEPDKIIITNEDYNKFNEKYELIRAQLLSLFMHNPIIFIGYSISDNNIKSILKTIFTYVDPNSDEAEKVRQNFLLVEHDEGSNNIQVVDHDIDIEGIPTIKINKIKTDNFKIIYETLSNLQLPVSAMDIRKVQNVFRDIKSGGDIRVSITDDLDSLKNNEKVLAVGSVNTIRYSFQNTSEIMKNYFKIIEEENFQLLEVVDKLVIQSQQFFPIFGFSKINKNIKRIEKLKTQQSDKMKSLEESMKNKDFKNIPNTIKGILDSEKIGISLKPKLIAFQILKGNIKLDDAEKYFKSLSEDERTTTEYRRQLCAYDIKKYK
ncbi:SIR2 family protein [Peptoniphilus sp. MSJ-1]|uniref:SIR2 family protein n=1 Tax=Peptoniphilus ovalis TaxID=2841503 RepID=A0ABS6FGF9_9FIRM|nr:SIR2 family protein [Peptoniphilus ovalis]MBU5669275.1 SIR2 family protein [Peptoniphilus ovalis]